MNGKELAKALRKGQRVYGTLVTSGAPAWVEVIKSLNLDYVFIDTEHVSLDREKVAWMCQAYKALGVAPIVRIPEPDPYLACMVIDGGASGVIAPYVESAEEVKKLYGAVKLRPLKGGKLRRVLDGEEQLGHELSDYLAERNSNNVLIVNIESTPAIASLNEILASPGLDAVLIGPHDLSCSLEIPEKFDDPLFEAEVECIIKMARKKGIGAGAHAYYVREGTVAQEHHWALKGANLIMHGADITAFKARMSEDLSSLRTLLGDLKTGKNAEIAI